MTGGRSGCFGVAALGVFLVLGAAVRWVDEPFFVGAKNTPQSTTGWRRFEIGTIIYQTTQPVSMSNMYNQNTTRGLNLISNSITLTKISLF